MRWLITTDAENDLTDLRQRISDEGGTVGTEPPIPLDAGEQVVAAEGPDDLPARLQDMPSVKAMHPDSDLELLDSAPDSIA